MNVSSESSDSDSDGPVRLGREALPEKINFYFLETGKSKGDTFKFIKLNVNRKGMLHYYACAHKLTHKCQARAIVKKVVEVDEVEGSEAVHFTLLELATPEVIIIQYS